MRKLYLLCFAFLCYLSAHSQAINTYLFTAASGTFTPITGGTADPGAVADDANGTTAIPIGFPFTFGGVVYNTVTANSNGWLSFNASPTTNGLDMRANDLAGTAAGLRPMVAALWDDLNGNPAFTTPGSPGVASYVTTGTTGSRVFTYEWLTWTMFATGSTAEFSFQVKLYEGTNVIEFIYRQESGSTTGVSSATVGIAGSSTDFISVGSLGASPTTSTTTSTNNLSGRPATGQIYRFTPPSPCVGPPNPGTIAGTSQVCTGNTTTLSLNGQTVATGLTYQWKSSTTPGGPYTPITGATAVSYTTPVVTATTYYVATITCGTNSATTPEFTVSASATPTITVTPAFPTICPGGSVALTASGAATYSWAPTTGGGLSATTGATVTASPTASTSYTVTGTSAAGCVATGTAGVTVGNAITATATADKSFVCSGGSATLGATINAPSYSIVAVPFAPVATPSSGVTTLVNNGAATPALSSGSLDDGYWSGLTLPFPFTLYGNSFTTFNVNTNGYITLGAASSITTTGYANTLPTTGAPNNAIYLVLADMNLGSAGSVSYFTVGSAPNRQFVINYTNVPFWSGGGTVTAQAVLYETTNIVEIYVSSLTNTASSKSEGLENGTGTEASIVNLRNNTTTWSGYPDGYRFVPSSYTYVWSPAANLSSATVLNPTASNITATTTFNLVVTDALSSCTTTASKTITVGAPVAATVSGPAGTLCGGSSVKVYVTATGGGQPYTYSWSNGTSVVGTADTLNVIPTATTTYTVTVTDACGATTTGTFTVNINNPQITANTPGSRCGPGPVAISATPSTGSVIRWYTAATGGTPIATGNFYSIPFLGSTTTYYAAAESGGTPIGAGASTSTSYESPYYHLYGGKKSQYLILASEMTAAGFTAGPINSVTFYVVGGAGTTYNNFAISMGGTTQTAMTTTLISGLTTVFPATAVTTTTGANQYVFAAPYNWNGTDNVVLEVCWSNNNGGGTSSTVQRDATSFVAHSYYRVDNTPAATLCPVTSATGTSSFRPKIQFNNYCFSSRTAITATVNPGPALTLSGNTSVCNNAIKAISVTSAAANYTSYVWSPTINLFSDAAATVPYTGGSATTVYVKTNTPGVYVYYMNALNSTSSCTGLDSLRVTVLPGNITLSASPSTICVSGTANLSVNPQTPYNFGTLQWFTSTNGTSYTVVTGPTGVNYTTPTLTATNYYRVDIKDAAGNVCAQPTVTVPVVNPTFTSTTPGVRCGPGTVSLTAAPSTGSVVRWYAAATGGTPLATGNSFTTPSLTQTTTYYAAPEVGNAPIGAGASTSTGFESPFNHSWGGKRSQYLILASELTAAGFTSGTPLNSLTFFVTSAGTSYNSFSISMGHTTLSALTTTLQGGLATVYTAASVTPTVGPNIYPFLAPFNWNGTDNVIVEVCWSNNNTGGTTANVKVDNTTFVSHSYYRNDSQTPAVICGTTSATATQSIRPQMQFNSYCAGNRVAVTATVSPNTGITTQPVATSICSGATLNLSVTAVGANLTYQWYNGSTAIAGATSATYSAPAATTALNGQYTVQITGLCGNVTSNAVTVTVSPANSWVGTTNTDWNNATNWCGGVPTPNTDVVIPAGTPYQPVLSASGDARNVTVNTGASLTVQSAGLLSVYGNFTNSGTFAASTGAVVFKGSANQSVGAITAGTIIMNGTGGATLAGNMTAITTLTLVNGNITLGTNNLILTGSANGSAASHVITNSTGSVISNNITTTAVTVPVGPDATSYNPVIISNGQGRNYTVRVATGINPAITNSARAINRTWNITPSSAVSSNVSLTFQYNDADGNSSVTPGAAMEVGVNSGTQWNLATPPGGITPVLVSGTTRQVTVQTNQFGPMVLSNGGGFTYPAAVSGLDPYITGAKLLPNVVTNETVLRVTTNRSTEVNWVIIDATGRVVMSFNRKLAAGTTDINLTLGHLAGGTYHLAGFTANGKVPYLRLVRM